MKMLFSRLFLVRVCCAVVVGVLFPEGGGEGGGVLLETFLPVKFSLGSRQNDKNVALRPWLHMQFLDHF